MGFLKTRLTDEKERRSGNSPFGNLLSLLGLKKEETQEELLLKDNLELFTNLKEQEVIHRLINSYEEGNYFNFYQEYRDKLPLTSIWGEDEFLQRAQKGSLLDLLIIWNLTSLDILYRLEWNKENGKEKLLSFISRRVEDFYNEDLKLDVFNQNFDSESDFDILYFLEKLDQSLTSCGYRLLYFGMSGEEYFIGVFDQKSADYLVGKSFGIVTLYPCSG